MHHSNNAHVLAGKKLALKLCLLPVLQKLLAPTCERGKQKTCPYRKTLLMGTNMHHSSDSQSYAGSLSLILKANPWWFQFVPWGDCLFLLTRDDPYFICYMRKAISISQSLESKQSHRWLNLALGEEFSLEEPCLLTETNHKARGERRFSFSVAEAGVPCAVALKKS